MVGRWLAAIALLAIIVQPAQALGNSLDGVLGGTQQSWIDAYGEPTRGIIGPKFGTKEIMVSSSPDGDRVRQLEVLLNPAQPITAARVTAGNLMPPDTQPIRSYTTPAGQTVELFYSAALADAFTGSPVWFGDAEPGMFISIVQRGGTATSSRIVLSTGNRP